MTGGMHNCSRRKKKSLVDQRKVREGLSLGPQPSRNGATRRKITEVGIIGITINYNWLNNEACSLPHKNNDSISSLY